MTSLRDSKRASQRPARSRTTRRQLLGAGLLAAGTPLLGGCFGLGDTEGLVLDQPGGMTPDEFSDRRRVVIWSSYTALNAEILQKNIDAFHEAQDEIYVEVQIFDGYEGVESKLAASLQARQVPDIAVLSDVVWNRFYLAEAREPLKGYFDADFGEDAFDERFLEEGTVKGDIWWLPFARSTPLFYYNREQLAAVALPDRAPDTCTDRAHLHRELPGSVHNANPVAMRGHLGGDDRHFPGAISRFGGACSIGLDHAATT